MGRDRVLAVQSSDPLLSALAAIGLGAAIDTALLVDLAGGLRIDSDRTLGDLIEHGPSRSELSPGRPGVAMLSGHPVDRDGAIEVIEELATAWPAIVLRCDNGEWPYPTVPVRPLYPGILASTDDSPAVWQPTAGSPRPPGPGPVLPRLGGVLVRRLLAGRLPLRSPWVASWRRVWDMPWA